MGKGKGTFEYWACRYVRVDTYSRYMYLHLSRVPTERVLFEIGGVPIREELARDSAYTTDIPESSLTDFPSIVLRIAASNLPTDMEFINRSSPPRLGTTLIHPPLPPLAEAETAQPTAPVA